MNPSRSSEKKVNFQSRFGPHPLGLHHRSLGCTLGHGKGCQCSDRSHSTLTRTSQNSMISLSWRRKDTIGVVEGVSNQFLQTFTVFFGFASTVVWLCLVLIGFLHKILCFAWTSGMSTSCYAAKNAHLIMLVSSFATTIQYQRYVIVCKGNPSFESCVEGKF